MRTFTFLGIKEFADKAKQLIYDGLALVNEALENSIGTTLVEMLIQLCCTLVIFLIVRFLIWNKVTEIIEKRKQVVRDALKERDDALEEAKLIKAEATRTKEESKKEAERIIENAKNRGNNEAEVIISNANETAKLKISNANEEIERMKSESKAQIKKEIVDVAYLMASKIVEKEIEKDKYDLPLEEFIQESKKDK